MASAMAAWLHVAAYAPVDAPNCGTSEPHVPADWSTRHQRSVAEKAPSDARAEHPTA
jgi:hypothetical protein